MAELALILSTLALIVALMALGVARSVARAGMGPRPNVLSQPRPMADVSGGQASDGQVSEEVLEYLRAGKKIEAIKQYRIETGAGLLEAKNTVEAIERGVQ